MRLTWKDAAATALVGGALSLYAGFLAGAGLPLVSGPRMLALAVLVLGVAACVTGGSVLATAGGEPATPLARWFSFFGTIAFVTAVLVMITGSEPLLAVLVGTIVMLWLAATLRHLLTPGGSRQQPAGRGVERQHGVEREREASRG